MKRTFKAKLYELVNHRAHREHRETRLFVQDQTPRCGLINLRYFVRAAKLLRINSCEEIPSRYANS